MYQDAQNIWRGYAVMIRSNVGLRAAPAFIIRMVCSMTVSMLMSFWRSPTMKVILRISIEKTDAAQIATRKSNMALLRNEMNYYKVG